MKKGTQYTISIPKPCPANREDMANAGRDKFCFQCRKRVVDLAGMTDEEIITVLKKANGGTLCGSFLPTQLNKPLLEPKGKHSPRYRLHTKIAAGLILLQGICSDAFSQASSKNTIIENLVPDAARPFYTLKGRILNYNSRLPVGNVIVELEELKLETVSDSNGQFSFHLNDTSQEKYTVSARTDTGNSLTFIEPEYDVKIFMENNSPIILYQYESLPVVEIEYEMPLMKNQHYILGEVVYKEDRKSNWFTRLFSRKKR